MYHTVVMLVLCYPGKRYINEEQLHPLQRWQTCG